MADFEIRDASFRPKSDFVAATYHSGPSTYPVFLAPDASIRLEDLEKVDVLIMNPSAPANENAKGYGLAFHLNEAGAEKLKGLTSGKRGQPIAIMVHDAIVSVPVIMEPLSSRVMLSGLTLPEADSLKKQIGLEDRAH